MAYLKVGYGKAPLSEWFSWLCQADYTTFLRWCRGGVVPFGSIKPIVQPTPPTPPFTIKVYFIKQKAKLERIGRGGVGGVVQATEEDFSANGSAKKGCTTSAITIIPSKTTDNELQNSKETLQFFSN